MHFLGVIIKQRDAASEEGLQNNFVYAFELKTKKKKGEYATNSSIKYVHLKKIF